MNRVGFLFGLAFGGLLVLSRFTDYDVIHNGLLFRDPTIYLVMASAVGTAMLVLWILERRRWHTPLGGALKLRRVSIEKKHIYGGLMFGTGWAVAGTCPTVSAAMVGEGRLLGLVVMAGLFIGVLVRDTLTQPRVAEEPSARRNGGANARS